jgi:uncharacterized protein YggE
MRTIWFAILLGCPVWAQLDSGSLTVTATRSIVVQPDQVTFSASVTAAPDKTLDDVLASVASAGITSADLDGVRGDATNVAYSFFWSVPISKLNETISALQSLRVSFGITGTQASGDLMATSRCSTSNLIADAEAQARKMAAAIGGSIGAVLSVSDRPYVLPAGVPTGVFRLGDFFGVLSNAPTVSPSPQLTCTLTVKFRLNQ